MTGSRVTGLGQRLPPLEPVAAARADLTPGVVVAHLERPEHHPRARPGPTRDVLSPGEGYSLRLTRCPRTVTRVDDRLVWLDLEMTGLDVERHVIVEIAALVTDDDLEPRRRRHRPHRAPAAERARGDGRLRARTCTRSRACSPRSRRRRSRSPTPARRCSSTSAAHVPRRGMRRCAATASASTAGSSTASCPSSTSYLHYRSIDVSSFKELCRRWYPAVYKKRPRQGRDTTGRSTTSASRSPSCSTTASTCCVAAAPTADASAPGARGGRRAAW